MIDKHFHDVHFNGKSLADFGVHVNGTDVFNGPEKDIENVEVPGRNGDLHIFNNRFKNVELKYHAFIAGDTFVVGDVHKDFSANVRGLRSHLYRSSGYCRLEDTYHPDEFREAAYKGPFTTEALFLQAGEFDLIFDCKPQRFLKVGERVLVVDSNKVIYNPTDFDAKPFIHAYGNGTITINGTIIRVNTNYTRDWIDIDCDIQDAFYMDINCNKHISLVDGVFPTLKPGSNSISISSGFSSIHITPRWWTI